MTDRRAVVTGTVVVTLLTWLLLFFIAEITLRSVHLLRDGIPFFETPSGRVGAITLDPQIGWRATERYEQDLLLTTHGGTRYPIHRSQTIHGFRRYGDVHTSKPKILIIGDSYTQATAVSDDKTYYAQLMKQLGVEVFAYGAGGYGTLQEYLILDEVFDEIQPSILIWQFCTNDFINNDYALEAASRENNNGWTRPYWIDGQVVLRSPTPMSIRFRDWANSHSRFLYFILSRLDRLQARVTAETVEREIERVGEQHPEFIRAVKITDELMGRVRARVGNIPIFAFSCENQEPYSSAFQKIAAHHSIRYWNDVPGTIQSAFDAGHDVLASDGHWNEQGHALVAANLSKHLQADHFMLAKQ